MQLNPRYRNDPLIGLEGAPAAIVEPTIRQRRRLTATLASLTDEQWAHASRCDGWSARDVVVHLESTNTFWTYSIEAGRRGEPTRFLADFDPVRSPAQLVAGSQDVPASEVLDGFVRSTEALADLLASLDDRDLSALAEAPPGHLDVSAVANHALWDSWVHERDILLPLGIAPDEEADEIAACLRYAAALGPALAVTRGTARRGVLTVAATEPDVEFVVDIGDRVVVREGTDRADLELSGAAVELLEALSIRRPLDRPLPEESAWMLEGLAEAFDPRGE